MEVVKKERAKSKYFVTILNSDASYNCTLVAESKKDLMDQFSKLRETVDALEVVSIVKGQDIKFKTQVQLTLD